MCEASMIIGNGVVEDGKYGAIVSLDDLYDTILAEHDARPKVERASTEALKDGKVRTLGPPAHIFRNAHCLAKTGWGIIWPQEADLKAHEQTHIDDLKSALADLIAFRAAKMKGKKTHDLTYAAGQDKLQFIDQFGLGMNEFDVAVIPYYLLIVGSPEQIPWSFQMDLDMDYAVGRLWFDDVADCRAYVKRLLAYEDPVHIGPTDLAKNLLLIGTQHEGDPFTQSTAEYLVPGIEEWLKDNDDLGFGVEAILGQVGGGAYRRTILTRLAGKDPMDNDQSLALPALLFTAGHGWEYAKPQKEQSDYQGALVCQDWPRRLATVKRKHYLAGEDVEGLDLSGMMAYCYACFSAGTPQKPDWRKPNLFGKLPDIAEKSFVAHLPQKLLANGMTAFIGHVSRAWDRSFLGPDREKPQTQLFTETIGEILRGQTVGHAMYWQNDRCKTRTVDLDRAITDKKPKETVVEIWLSRNDLRDYVVLGDPAARVRLDLWE